MPMAARMLTRSRSGRVRTIPTGQKPSRPASSGSSHPFPTTLNSSTMKLAKYIGLILLFSSCQKVISVNLDSTSRQYVIVGTLTDQPGVCQVSITQTKNFNDNNQFPG